MSDVMRLQPFEVLLDWMLGELKARGSVFGIPRALFHEPRPDAPYVLEDFLGHRLGTPIGPAAGPHTQLAQNIVSAWLTGGRFIELKTVQVLDELEIPRPCIDMEDEGYNVEWSQELKLDQSAWEYIKAWVLIHILRQHLGFDKTVPLETIFNMSVGYDLAGITSPRMTSFMNRLTDAGREIAQLKEILRQRHPEYADIEIPTQIAGSVTLSTMHGCPPDEIENIARYLLEERGLHTFVKLNPTLLGKDEVLRILHDNLGFDEIEIPDSVFEHDLQYDRAVELIRSLKQVAARRGLVFGVKLSNTLAMKNHRGVLPGEEVYMSGRALFPITMNLFWKLAREFDGDLHVSYAGGVDAWNVVDVLAAGAVPVTVASDLLKPGGYAKFHQYIENIETAMHKRGAKSLSDLSRDGLENLRRAAAEALRSLRYKKSYFRYGLPKVNSGLGPFDCVAAPCVEQCAVGQDIPEYAWWIAQGDHDRALEAILAKNPLPGVTGYVCTHLCQTRCTRNNYEEPVAIRALKRFAFEHGRPPKLEPAPPTGKRVAIIGSGPAGLSAAYFLALSGVEVTIYEAKERPGGMMRLIPGFRLPDAVIAEDVGRITALGAVLKTSHPVTMPPEELLAQGFDAVYIATGMQRQLPLFIDGIEGKGVFSALELLERARRGERVDLGTTAVVVGGGDTAMDAARVARRLTQGQVTVVYRRSRTEMPASEQELEDALEEGVILEELATPVRVILRDGRVVGVECVRNRLGEPGEDGRRRPVPIPGSEFTIGTDSLIVAIGQQPDLTFLSGSSVTLRRDGGIEVDPRTGRTSAPRVYAGGDVAQGPHSIIAACSDGMRAARAICQELGIAFRERPTSCPKLSEADIAAIQRMQARKEPQRRPAILPPKARRGFELIESTLSDGEAQAEAARCLQCSSLCDKCVQVCPNRANLLYHVAKVKWRLPVLTCREGKLSIIEERKFEIKQTRQILHIDDFCNECGNCTTFCVHQGKPYLEKPRLFLREEDFLAEEENAFYIRGDTIRRREGGKELMLTLNDEGYVFENEWLRISLSPDFRPVAAELKQGFSGTLSLVPVAEMAVILSGVKRSLPYLPVWEEGET